MGKSAPSPPPAPDPVATAAAQSRLNTGTATAQTALNNVNVNSAYGNSFFGQSGSVQVPNGDGTYSTVPTYTEQINLAPAQQQLLDQQNSLGIQTNTIAGRALNSIGGTLSAPITQNQLSPLQLSAGQAPTLATGYGVTGNATGYDPGGPVQTSVGQDRAPTSFGQTAQGVQGQIGGTAGGVRYGFAPTASSVQGDIAGSNSFSADRDAATNAALARLQPSMDQGNAQLQAQLANQGVSLGSSAYGSAMFNRAQANNDLRLGAVQTGDAEQQALFGESQAAGAFHNAAQQQQFDQAQGRGAFNNAAQAQDFGQQAQRGAFANAAQAQDYAQQQGRGQFEQGGVAANNAAALAAGQFANAAQGQQNAESAAQAQFYNQGVNANNANNAALAAFGNDAATQAYQNRLAGYSFDNSAAGQQLQQRMALQNQQINEISALRSGGQVTGFQAPNYTPGTIDQNPYNSDVYASAGMQNQQYLAQLQASAANTSAMGSALGGIMGGIGRKSDVRLKSDIAPVARARNGLMIYRYRMPCEGAGWHLGFLAHEVALVRPEAVWTDPGDGWARVDYERAAA